MHNSPIARAVMRLECVLAVCGMNFCFCCSIGLFKNASQDYDRIISDILLHFSYPNIYDEKIAENVLSVNLSLPNCDIGNIGRETIRRKNLTFIIFCLIINVP